MGILRFSYRGKPVNNGFYSFLCKQTHFVLMYLYRLFTWLYPKAVWLISFSSEKAELWRNGRKGIFKKLSAAFHNNTAPVIWMHCASLGEFEQGLPVLLMLKEKYPSHKILITFFSPSGYEVRKNYTGADHVFYMPMDSPSHATRFLNIVQPSLVLFVKYEFWYFYLHEIQQRNIPLLLISGIFRKDQLFFKWYGRLHRNMLSFFSYLFVQNQASLDLLKTISVENAMISGDTRFDRVINIAADVEPIPLIADFCNGQPVIVAGSTWTEDDEELDHFANTHPSIKFIIAPHDIETERLEECSALYKHSMLFSDYSKAKNENRIVPEEINTLIIDNIGMLSKLYRYAHICYIGGGFGNDGIHNILEAAVYSKPIVFGPVYDKYFEADELLDAGGAFTIDDALELEQLLEELLNDTNLYTGAAKASGKYVAEKSGAAKMVMDYIQEKRLLIS